MTATIAFILFLIVIAAVHFIYEAKNTYALNGWCKTIDLYNGSIEERRILIEKYNKLADEHIEVLEKYDVARIRPEGLKEQIPEGLGEEVEKWTGKIQDVTLSFGKHNLGRIIAPGSSTRFDEGHKDDYLVFRGSASGEYRTTVEEARDYILRGVPVEAYKYIKEEETE